MAGSITSGAAVTIQAAGGPAVTVTFTDATLPSGVAALDGREVVAAINAVAQGFSAALNGPASVSRPGSRTPFRRSA
jgi:hypothetical protein